jgi:geranylgeranyl pyrophosphate synthase/predicted secreted hydrolase
VTKLPADWPAPGPVDLAVHDLPHASSTTEWWYLNGHLVTEGARRYSFFAAFFRKAKGRDPKTHEKLYAHSLTWALCDVDGETFPHVSRVDDKAAEEGLKRMNRGLGSKDGRLNRALREILERGKVPTPDRVFGGNVFVHQTRLELDYVGDTFRKNDDGTYTLKLFDKRQGLGCELTFEPQKPPTRHGEDGIVRGSDDETMFYYFITRNKVTGSVTHRGETLKVEQGQGWYDHEFGFSDHDDVDDEAEAKLPADQRAKVHAERRKQADERQVGWNWVSAQLDDGTEFSVYPETYVHSGKSAGNHTVTIGPKGERGHYTDATVEPLEIWQSTQTFFEYPTRFRVKVPSAGIDVEVNAAFDDQEFITLISKPSFWEGRIEIKGTRAGKPVTGLGYVERSGFAPFEDLDGFFEQVGKTVRRSVEDVLPKVPSYKQARDLLASKDKEHYMEGVDVEQYARTHIHPIREIVDRGGKGWRSYAAITCCDIVGGDSREFVQWLAMPELMHVGSLIVDDVQDKSVVRRGGKTAHMIYGEAQAINSGTAAYFIGHRLLRSEKVSDRDQLKLYELYFDALRAGHAGQALDIDGFEQLMPSVVKEGKSEVLESRVLAVHRLKTAAPAGCLARMGAIGGGGTEEQVEALGRFFEDVGLAFQIIDDVLNLRGFKGNLKDKAEDVMQGKITLPVAKSMSRLSDKDRAWLYDTLHGKPQDPKVVAKIVEMLESCGAVEACSVQARDLVEGGWRRLEPLIPDSLAKMMLRSFGWYVLERHY